ncbi:stalk domain-containing protein [Paenibacillus algorifonticola]|uniref:stalk domain-containing protein n=1 Tax=Paenibacillus algorifonticola TaxID=684063 RepID=UPI003D2926FA
MRKLVRGYDQGNRGIGKKVAIVIIGGALLLHPISELAPASWKMLKIETAAAASSGTLKQLQQSYVTSGAERIDYLWTTTRSGRTAQANVHVIEVDLTNKYVQLNALSGKNNTIGDRDTILNMAKTSGAVAGINGDVYVTTGEGSPMGAQITSGTLMTTPMQIKGMYAFGVTKDRQPKIDSYSFSGTVTSASGATFTLSGINQSSYTPESGDSTYSHANTMYIYTSAWAGSERPKNSAALPTEVLVRNGVVEQISDGTALAMAAPKDGYILRANGTAAKFIRAEIKVGDKLKSDYSLVSQTTGSKVDPNQFEMMVSGHTILVNNGAASAFSRSITGVSGAAYLSRSAVGYSKDGTKVYLITSEQYGDSKGVNLAELQQIMVKLGVYKGINLDGGGSTTMIERPLGQFALQSAHSTTYGTTMRSVASGIGVFSTAPKGEVKGITVSGTNALLIGQQATFTVKGYDTYYNPVAVDGTNAKWSSSSAVGTFKGADFTATKAGSTTISVKSGSASATYQVDVVGQDQIASMTIDSAAGMLSKGATVSVPVTMTLKNGKSYKLSGDSLKWEFVGFTGKVSGDMLTVQSVDEGATTGYAIGRYDGYPTMLPLTQGGSEKALEDFENVNYGISTQLTPSTTTKGSVKLTSDLAGQTSAKALQLTYDFSAGTGTKAVYAVFNGTSGKSIEGSPTAMTLDVYSDKSLNWLRAEFTDADGESHLVDVAKQLNWSGWKTVKADLSSYGMKYPIKLKRVYVVTIAEGADERAATGTIGIDNMKLQYPGEAVSSQAKNIVMTIGSKAASIGGKATTLDVTPITLKGTTYVPIRFVSEALGANLQWDNKLNRVTVFDGAHLLEMVIGKKEIVANGKRSTTEVAPIVRNNRTLIPIRLFSEQLGLKVGFDNSTKKITIN